ncbi:thioredoxin H2-like [Prosopis cineraria]|uniref:thioredoxin H2-like n=1 Tax=Prosopis cineraria TaxID=364024 RepID=UPI00240FAC07|nr:thioredoxin H2-like [Prosopis cineraria]
MRTNVLDMGFLSRSSESSSNILSFHSTAKWNAHFNASKETDKLMVIDFNATWCGPCKFMDSVIQEFAAKYTDVEFIKIDVDELMEVSQVFQVQTLPAFILIKKGKVAERVTGARKEELQKLIENHRRVIV